MDTDAAGLEAVVSRLVDILKLLGVVAGIAAILALVIGLVLSIIGVVFRGVTLIHPFAAPSDLKVRLNGLLALVVEEQRREWAELADRIEDALESGQRSAVTGLVDFGPALHDASSGRGNELIAPTMAAATPIGPISVAGTTFSPDMLIRLLDEIRARVARNTIRGEYFRIGNQLRLTATVGGLWKKGHQIVLVRRISDEAEHDQILLDLVHDLAFQITKHRIGADITARTWSGYYALLRGLLYQSRYLGTGETDELFTAMGLYENAINIERAVAEDIGAATADYHLAHLFLGNLLYNRYIANDNRQALSHYRYAAESRRTTLKALALAGVARACFQEVHRYGAPNPESFRREADRASEIAIETDAELPDVWLARGYAHQVCHRQDEAIEAYSRTLELVGVPPQVEPRDQRPVPMAKRVGYALGDPTRRLAGFGMGVVRRTGDLLYSAVDYGTEIRSQRTFRVRYSDAQLRSMAWNNRGFLIMSEEGRDNEERALTEFGSAIDAAENKMAYANTAEVYSRWGMYREARDAFSKALALDPDYVGGHNELGMLHLRMAANARDGAERSRALESAEISHRRAAQLVADGPEYHRAEVDRRFKQKAKECGFEVEGSGEQMRVTWSKEMRSHANQASE